MEQIKRKLFGITLLRLRNKYKESRGLTARSLAEHLKVSPVYLYDVEGSRRGPLPISSILLLGVLFTPQEVISLLLVRALDREAMEIPKNLAHNEIVQEALRQWMDICKK